jgi:phage terminase large subunit
MDYKEYFQQGTSQEGIEIVLNPYEPCNEQTPLFHQCPTRIRALFGGNRSGKTEAGIYDDLLVACQPKKQIVISTKTKDMIGRFIYPKVKKYLPQKYVKKTFWYRTGEIPTLQLLVNGSRIHYMSYDQGWETFQGVGNIDQAHMDEEGERRIYIELLRSVIDAGGRFILTMTPTKGLTWVYDDIYEKADTDQTITHWTMNFLDNTFISQENKDFWLSQLGQDEKTYRVYGLFHMLEGAVFKEFDPTRHIVDVPPIPWHWRKMKGVDFGWDHPFVCLWMALTPITNAQIYQEHFQSAWLLGAHAKKIQEMDWFHLDNKENREPQFEPGVCDWDKQDWKELEALGIPLSPADKSDQKMNIERVNRWFHQDRIVIDRGCKNTIRQVKNWHYPERKEGKPHKEVPVDIDDDTCDVLCYLLAAVDDSSEHVPTFTGAGQRTPMSSELKI